jgi:hypothetical protein
LKQKIAALEQYDAAFQDDIVKVETRWRSAA